MKAHLLFLCSLLLLTSLQACKKKVGENDGLDDKNKQVFDIMPTTDGSWWLYKADDGAVFYRYATGTEAVVEGLTFNYFYRIDTTSDERLAMAEYFGKNDGKYISLIDVDGAQKSYITYVILKDNWFVGMQWDNYKKEKLQGWNIDMHIASQILSTSESLSINGKTYDSVIHVYNNLEARSVFIPAYTKCGTLEIWFKKGVGIIKEVGNIKIAPAGVALVEKTYGDELIDYHFEP